MLKKKQDEAKEVLVRAIVNNNLLLMLNHPTYEEKISFIIPVLFSGFFPDSACTEVGKDYILH